MKSTKDIIQGISKLDNLLKVSILQIYKVGPPTTYTELQDTDSILLHQKNTISLQSQDFKSVLIENRHESKE